MYVPAYVDVKCWSSVGAHCCTSGEFGRFCDGNVTFKSWSECSVPLRASL